VDRRLLADHVVLADHQLAGAPGVGEDLGRSADHGEGMDHGASAHPGPTCDVDLRSDLDPARELDLPVDHGQRADDGIVGDLRAGIDDCGGMDLRHDAGQPFWLYFSMMMSVMSSASRA
jgi:hypothetical protein